MTRKLAIAIVAGILFTSANTKAQQTDFKFRPAVGKVSSGVIRLDSTSVFSDNAAYGFDLGSGAKIIDRGGKDPLRRGIIAGDKPFFFSVNVPEGNYKVTLVIGDAKEAGELTVKAESRRLMLEKVITKAGEFVTKTFVVNVRKPAISTGGKVSLKDREVSKLDWDNKLTLEFNGAKPRITAIDIVKDDHPVTIYLAGNSTVVDQGAEPWASWGQMIPRFFNAEVAIANHAESGLTLASFKGGHRLEKILSIIKPGDYLFVEFGHNDQKMKGPNDGAWKSYAENLKYFIDEVKKKQAYAVVVTSTSRRRFDENGKTINTLGDFPDAARKVAADENVPLIDLNKMTAAMYDALGVERSMKALVHYPANTFPGQDKALADNTHFNSYGAYEIAKCVIQGIRDIHLGLEKFIIDLPAFNPANPDDPAKFDLPPSPGTELVKPDGN